MANRPRQVLFGFSPWKLTMREAAQLPRIAAQAERAGLDLLTFSDHPYVGAKLDAYVSIAAALSGTSRLRAAVSVTNTPLRPAPMLARTLTSLSAV